MSTYYTLIDGKRYDRALLAQAKALTLGSGDGRISLADAEVLLTAVADGQGITPTEFRTLDYILQHFNLTAPAKALFENHAQQAVDYQRTIKQAANRFGVKDLSYLKFTAEEIELQTRLAGNVVGFDAMINTVFELLFTAEAGRETPFHIISSVLEIGRDDVANEIPRIQDKLRAYLASGQLWLVPHGVEPDESADFDFEPAENRETTIDNWICYLSLPELSDHLYWTIVPRNGDQPYLYGFN